jgi:hypothetical protein
MRRAFCLITSIAALAAAPAAVQASDGPPDPTDLICGPTANCQVEPLPELPPVLGR